MKPLCLGTYLLFFSILSFSCAVAQEVPSEKRLVQRTGPALVISDKNLEKLTQLDTDLSLLAFFSAAREIAPDGCPTIYSPWYCDRIRVQGDSKQADHELQVRAYGKRLLEFILSHTNSIIAASSDPATGLSNAEQLLDLTDWIAKGDGYGNCIIASRCRALAGISLACAIVEKGVPIDAHIRSLIDRADAGGKRGWIESIVRAHEHEAPDSIAPFVADAGGGAPSEQFLGNAAIRAEKLRTQLEQKENIHAEGGTTDSAIHLRRKLPSDVAIWVDDPFFGSSMLKLWDVYRFEHNEVHTKLLGSLRMTCLFLDKLGGFPDPSSLDRLNANDRKLLDRKFYQTLTEVTFSNAWEDFTHRKEFLQSNVKTDPQTGGVYIDPKAEDLTAKYYKMQAGLTAAILYDNVKLGRMSSYLMGDAPGK